MRGAGSDGGAPDAEELIRLNHALDEQVKELVRAEQRLFRSQRDLGRQVARLDALNRFALDAVELSTPAELLARAIDTLFRMFPFDQALGFQIGGDGVLPVVARAVPGREADDARVAEALAKGPVRCSVGGAPIAATAAVIHAQYPDVAPLVACVERVFDAPDLAPDAAARALILVVPLVRGATVGALVFRRVTDAISYHDELPSERDAAFLGAFAQAVAGTLTHVSLLHDLKLSYERLADAQRELVVRERLAAIGEFAAVVAHEVRNPLGAILNAVALLRRTVEGPEAPGLVDIVGEESSRLSQIVSDLIDFARPNPPTFRDESLVRIVECAIEGVRASHPHARFVLIADEAPALVRLDARLMRQAMVNLLVNAVQASPSGAEVRIVVAREEDRARIALADRGEGIVDTTRIFEPFFTTKPTGTGLGLSVVRRVIEAHGGEVRVESSPGLGSTFVVFVPTS